MDFEWWKKRLTEPRFRERYLSVARAVHSLACDAAASEAVVAVTAAQHPALTALMERLAPRSLCDVVIAEDDCGEREWFVVAVRPSDVCSAVGEWLPTIGEALKDELPPNRFRVVLFLTGAGWGCGHELCSA